MTMKTEEVIRLCQERAAAYGALRASSPTAIALDAAAERLAELHAVSARERRSAKTPLVVWSPDGETPPKVAHTTHGSAHRAAHLLAKKHPGQTFFVMERSGRPISTAHHS